MQLLELRQQESVRHKIGRMFSPARNRPAMKRSPSLLPTPRRLRCRHVGQHFFDIGDPARAAQLLEEHIEVPQRSIGAQEIFEGDQNDPTRGEEPPSDG